MAIPNTARSTMISGLPGCISHDGPTRAAPFVLDSGTEANNVFGRAFTLADQATETAQAGGAGTFVGIMINPKTHAIATDYAGNGTVGEFCTMGELCVQVEAAANIGDAVFFEITTGKLTAAAATPGVTHTLIKGATVVRHAVSAETPRIAHIALLGPQSN